MYFWLLWVLVAALRCNAKASHCDGFSYFGAWAVGAWASVLMDQTKDQTLVACAGRQILNHWTTGEAPRRLLINSCCQ